MRIKIQFLLGFWGMAMSAWFAQAAEAPARFALQAPVLEIVTSTESFNRFAGPLPAALKSTDSGLELKLRLGLQVHLALDAQDSAAALAAARELRALQTNPDEKGLTGLMTEAQVASWSGPATFGEELTARLAKLPHTVGTTSALKKMHDKIASTTREALLAEAAQMGRRLDSVGSCGWLEVDQIVRLRHRLVNIIPLRATTLASLDEAISVRSKP